MIRGLTSHAVAALVSVVLLTLLPTVAYALLAALSLATEGNMGGPLNLLLMPVASLVGAVAFTAFSGLLTLLAQAGRRRWGFGAWVPAALGFVAGALLGTLAALAKGAAAPGRAAVAGALLFGLAFSAYWLPFAAVHALLGRLWRSPSPGT
jgi:putative exporter of polyketide antibiotics